EGLGTNRMDEIDLQGAPLDRVKRRFRRQSTILQGQYPNVNVVMGSTCEAGCKAIVRIQLDQLKADGTLDRLQRPLYVFTGLQFEERIQPVDGDVIVHRFRTVADHDYIAVARLAVRRAHPAGRRRSNRGRRLVDT